MVTKTKKAEWINVKIEVYGENNTFLSDLNENYIRSPECNKHKSRM